MSYQLRKRHRESGHDSNLKHPKQNENKELVNIKRSKANAITDLCHELLERIFDFLDFESLLNVGKTCKRLQSAAAAKFAHDIGERAVILHLNRKNEYGSFHVNNFGIWVFGIKNILPFLRCFGAKVSTLILSGFSEDTNDFMNRYINQHCADTLANIEFDRFFEKMQYFFEPFKMVERIEVIGSVVLGKQFSNFELLFPNLRQLELYGSFIKDDFAAPILPHLEQLTILGLPNCTHPRYHLAQPNLTNLLQANRQLQTFIFRRSQKSMSELLDIIGGNPLITKLDVSASISATIYVNAAELSRLAREHPAMVELNLPDYILHSWDAITFIQELHLLKSKLKLFRFGVQDKSNLIKNLPSFVNIIYQLKRFGELNEIELEFNW